MLTDEQRKGLLGYHSGVRAYVSCTDASIAETIFKERLADCTEGEALGIVAALDKLIRVLPKRFII